MQEINEIAQFDCLSSYHHQLKSYWLDSKWNLHINHLVHVLIIDMLPHYIARCHSQDLGFKGPNLAEK